MYLHGLLAVLCTAALAYSADIITPCIDGGSPEYLAAKVLVNEKECTGEPPCKFPRGAVVAGLLTFASDKTVTSLSKHCNATIVGTDLTVPYPIPNATLGCSSLEGGSYCPLDPREQATLRLSMPILDLYPQVDLTLKMYILDQDNVQLGCMRVAAQITERVPQ